ncbi:MAG: hypothetical protein ACOX19_12895 [Fermentimonas sp.]
MPYLTVLQPISRGAITGRPSIGLNRIEGDPRTWNNLGVAYVRFG